MNIPSKLRVLGFAGLFVAAVTAAGVMSAATATAQEPAKGAGAGQGQVTFTKEVAPILQRSCQFCHRPGSIAPMSLLTYEDARPYARAIKRSVSRRDMPPWFIDRKVGVRKFKNDVSLTDQEIATLVAWVDSGAPRGNPADMPPPRVFEDVNKWHIGTPELVVQMPVEHTIPADGSDWWGNFETETGLTEDRYIKAVEMKPSPEGMRGVHHGGTSLILDDGDPFGSFLNEYAVGKNGDVFPENSGRLMKAGVRIRFGMHYHSIGEEIRDRASVAFVFYPKGVVPKYVLNSVHVGDNADIDIPAGASNVRHDGYTKLDKPARITAFQPHMHNRGKAQCLEAIYPNMQTETLSCVDRYQFGWHLVYVYADDVAPLLPAGTILHVISWHDNSVSNKFNPDPKNWVGFGQRSSDDMSFAWVSYYSLSEEDYKAEAAARANKSN